MGAGRNGDEERMGRGGLSASAQKRINSTRSNGLTAKRAHPGAAPRGRDGAGEGREKGRGVGRRGSEDGRGKGRKSGRDGGGGREIKRENRKGQRESGSEGGQDSLRGGVSSTSFPHSSLGRRNLSRSGQTPAAARPQPQLCH